MIDTVKELFKQLGGVKAVAEIAGVTPKTASSWKCGDRLPAHSYPSLQSALADKELRAALSLWPTIKTPRTVNSASAVDGSQLP